jgi:flagella basal body P-ring formation protein FlgA
MKSFAKGLLFLFFIHCFCGFALALEARFKEKATVDEEFFTLGDVATLNPPSSELASRVIYRSPAPGKKMTYKAAEIQSYLQQTDDDFQEVSWTGAGTIHVTREGLVIAPQKVVEIINQYLEKNRLNTGVKNIHMVFVPSRSPRSFILPKGRLSYRVIPSAFPLFRSQSFNITFSIDGRVEKNLAVRGDLNAKAPVVVATSDIPRGTLLSADDIRVVTKDLNKLRDPCYEPQQLLGQKVKRSLRKGAPIEKSMVDFPPLVKRGEIITVAAISGGLKVTATGIAKSNGQEGDTIRVKNSGSGKEILCKVIGPGLVAVEF